MSTRSRGLAWNGQLLLMLLPFLLGIGTLVFLPALLAIPLAFTSYNALDAPRFNGLQNFRDLWHDHVFWLSIRNTLGFLAIAVPVRLAGALALAMLLLPLRRGVAHMRTAVFLPTEVPDIAWALAWLWILNPLYGPMNLALGLVGIEGPAWMLDETGARAAIILMMSWQLGEGFVVCLGALSGVPVSILEQSMVDGAGRWARFQGIVLPLIAPYLVLLAIRDALFGLHATFVPAKILGQDGGLDYATTYLPMWIYTNAFGYLRVGYATAMSWVTFAFTLVMIVLFLRVTRRLDRWHL